MMDVQEMVVSRVAEPAVVQEPLRIFVVAGEASGDLLGANLMHALKNTHPDIEFYGVGGKQMQDEGLQSLFPMEDLSVMGLAEVLPRLFKIIGIF